MQLTLFLVLLLVCLTLSVSAQKNFAQKGSVKKSGNVKLAAAQRRLNEMSKKTTMKSKSSGSASKKSFLKNKK